MVYIVTRFHEFDIELWEKVGFKFTDEESYDGLSKHARAGYGSWILNLSIASITIASIENKGTYHTGRHAVSESEGVKWFCRVSQEFKDKFKTLDYK